MFDIKKALQVYLVTDDQSLHGKNFDQVVENAITGGVSMVQLREKTSTSRAFYERAKKIREITQYYQIPFLINDRLDIALAVEADGVHVGQKDLPVCVARRILGSKKIIGATAATVELARQAERDGADYLGSGAVFATPTKSDANPLEIEQLKAIVSAVSIPVVAIGGITIENVSQLTGTGIAGVAISSGIMGCQDEKKAAEQFSKIRE